MVAAAVRLGVGEQKQLAKAAFEAQIQRLRRPQNADLGFAPRIGVVPLPVSAEYNWAGALPLNRGMRRIQTDFLPDMRRNNLRRRRGILGIVLRVHHQSAEKSW